eukprot:XP_001696783.1 predicted protein [Chlamydomonas reinhardtii]
MALAALALGLALGARPAAAGVTVSDLSSGEVVGVVLGSVFGALLLVVGCLGETCDTRAKHLDLEAAAREAVPHVPVPDGPSPRLSRGGGATASPSGLPVAVSASGPRLDLGPAFDDLAALESERQQQARLQHLADGGAPSPTGATVSRSARVEPSAEVELAGPFEPAATNLQPPAGGAYGPPLDRLPLLSLAAQQQGIVWSKMPPSVASSPAVSVTEGSAARHMLLGAHKAGSSLRRPSNNGDVMKGRRGPS